MRPCISHPTNEYETCAPSPDWPAPRCAPRTPHVHTAGPNRDEPEPEGPRNDPSPLLDDSDESAVVDLDDSEAADIDPGVFIDDALGSGDDAAPELVFDIGTLLSQIDELEEIDDATGPRNAPENDLPALDDPGAAEDDAMERSDECMVADLDLGQLPELDEDGRGDLGIVQEGTFDSEICDDPLPPWSDAPWAEQLIQTEQGYRCLALGPRTVVLAGSVMRWLDADSRQQRHETMLESPAMSCAVLPHDRALVSDARGALWYAAPSSPTLQPAPGWQLHLHESSRGYNTLELHTAEADGGQVLLGLTSGGRLLVATEQGDWAPMELHARVLTLGSSAAPCVALLQSRRGRVLVSSTDGGANWCTIDAPREAQGMVGEEPPMLAAVSSALLVAHPLRGAAVSIDSGRTFDRIPGCNNISAVCAGELGGVPAFWLALHSDTSETTSIVLVRAPTWQPLRIGELRTARSGRADLEHASRRITALAWHNGSRQLWGVGEFGAATWQPVPAPLAS